MVPIRQGQEPQSSCPSWPLPLMLGSGGGDWKDKRDGGDGGVGGSSRSTGTGPGADSPDGALWAAWLGSDAWDRGGAWFWLWVCWRMFKHSPRQLSVAADVALSSSRSWSRQESGPLVGRESMDWTRFFCWPSAWDITWGTIVMYSIKIHNQSVRLLKLPVSHWRDGSNFFHIIWYQLLTGSRMYISCAMGPVTASLSQPYQTVYITSYYSFLMFAIVILSIFNDRL